MTDSGMVAVLDPRLLKVGPLAYNQSTRGVYLKALDHFQVRYSDLGDATEFLRGRTTQQAA